MIGDVFQKCILILFIWFLFCPKNARVRCKPAYTSKFPLKRSYTKEIGAKPSLYRRHFEPSAESSGQDKPNILSSAESSEKSLTGSDKLSEPGSAISASSSEQKSAGSIKSESSESSDQKPLCSDKSASSSSAENKLLEPGKSSSSKSNEASSESAESAAQSSSNSDKSNDKQGSTSIEVKILEPSNPTSASSADENSQSSEKELSAEKSAEKSSNSDTELPEKSKTDAGYSNTGLNEINEESKTHSNEPGFDLTDAEIEKFKIWPQGTIPYFIDDFSFDKVLRDRLRRFLESTNSLTGLHFVELLTPPTNKKVRWVFFINRKGTLDCVEQSPEDFTNEGVQKVVVGYDCLINSGGPAAAILSLVGVPPMHTAPNRDQYVTINEDNIESDKKQLFAARGNQDWLFHDVAYDFNSASQFSWHKYSVNGKATITPKVPKQSNKGSPNILSSTDVLKIRMLYNYISTAKLNKGKISSCRQLFVPGSNFGDYVPDTLNKVSPRPKPSKYAGGSLSSNEKSSNGEPGSVEKGSSSDSNSANKASSPDAGSAEKASSDNSSSAKQASSEDPSSVGKAAPEETLSAQKASSGESSSAESSD